MISVHIVWYIVAALVACGGVACFGFALFSALSFERGNPTPKSPKLRQGPYWK